MAEKREPFTVAIIGGGIGGLFAALSIHHHCAALGISVNVYEQTSEYKEIGAGVGIGINAAKLIHKLGLGEAANKIAGDRNGVWLAFRRSDNGAEIATVPVNDRDAIRQLPMLRSAFLDLLLDSIMGRNAATLHTKIKCTRLVDIGDKVRLEFANSTSATAHLVIGADGIHSLVRSQFAFDNPRYSGKIVYRGLVSIEDLQPWWHLSTYAVSWVGKDKHLLVFPISENKLLNVVAFVSVEESELGDFQESWVAVGNREEVVSSFQEFEPHARRILELMPERPSKWVVNEREPLEQWIYVNGKVALLGDSAHAMSPHQGAGAGQAIEDGYILGRALQDYLKSQSGDLGKWMQAYQTLRLPRAQRAQRTFREAGEVYELQGEGLKGKTFDECMPELRNRLKDRMNWVWLEDIDVMYEKIATEMRGQ
ncbi:hypothetical protein VE03_08237 [Pseudogymnoascus sp. 23342-1-I1]|nr:hypothetical protein VE03_08203 [Pseudogymnoascus sp. 23342-1-I1]OBT61948.1 hypothetical protein VE03_08237 [Pseudogymnoascus sp. 23342-1-I1]